MMTRLVNNLIEICSSLVRNQNPYATRLYDFKNSFQNSYFVSFLEYNRVALEWAKTLPRDIDLIISIPRQGLIPGSIAALHLGKPLSTPDLFVDGKYLISTWWYKRLKLKKVLLVDDSVNYGKQMRTAKELLTKKYPGIEILTGAPYVKKERSKEVDYYKVTFNSRVIFEMSLIHTYYGSLGTDLDGVLCEDVPSNMCGDELEEFYINAKPYKIPLYKINFIATGRLERYRDITEKWLKKHNVNYNKLIMRKEGDGILKTKIDAIHKNSPWWFWESSNKEAKLIFLTTGCRTLCFKNTHLYGECRDVLI